MVCNMLYCYMDHCIPITLCFFLSHTPNAAFSVRKGGGGGGGGGGESVLCLLLVTVQSSDLYSKVFVSNL